MAKAHFNFNDGTCSAVIPAAAAGWKRQCFSGSGSQPFQRGCVHGLASASGAAHRFFIEDAARGAFPPNDLPVTSSAIVRFCGSVMFSAWLTIDPVVSAASTRSGAIWRSASRLGARLVGPGLSWHVAQRRSKPITCAALDAGTAGESADGGCDGGAVCGGWVRTAAEPTRRRVSSVNATFFVMDECLAVERAGRVMRAHFHTRCEGVQ